MRSRHGSEENTMLPQHHVTAEPNDTPTDAPADAPSDFVTAVLEYIIQDDEGGGSS